MKRFLFSISVLVLLASSCMRGGLCEYDINAPFGWAVCKTLQGGSYDLTGGAKDASRAVSGRKITIVASQGPAEQVIADAVRDYDIIVLDGSEGEFVIPQSISFQGVRNKTIVGINGAVLRTRLHLTDEILSVMEHANERYGMVEPDAEAGAFVLSNGQRIDSRNRKAFCSRQALIDYFGDPEETYVHCGIFSFEDGCENIIVRNLSFEGPGSFRVLADNLIRITRGSRHLWIDHCSFRNPGRTAVSVALESDFVTVSWCSIAHDPGADHALGFFVTTGHEGKDVGKLNTTIAYTSWHHVWSRMPVSCYGYMHVLNNYYDCPGSVGANPRQFSKFLVEGSYFCEGSKAFCRYHIDVEVPDAYVWRDNRYGTSDLVEDKGDVVLPYEYKKMDVELVPELVDGHAGPTLAHPLRIGR